MSECRMIVSFSVRDGKISDDSNSMKYPEDLRELCAQYFGIADGFMAEVADEEDAPRERSLDALLGFCRASSVPVYGRGRIKRLEDVKKLIYAGCACAILDRNVPSNVQMEQEAQERFGKDHIAFAEDGAGSIVFPDSGSYETRILNIAEWPADKLAALRKSMQESGAVFKDRGAAFRWEDFKKGPDGLLTVVVQEEATDQVLMVAYMNEEAYNMTVSTGRMTYYSRSRKSLWIKGETSSHYQYVRSLYADCDMDTLLAKVVQIGPACHTGSHSCFFREDFTAETAASSAKPEEVLRKDFETILDRQRNPVSGSYTNYLFDKGLDKMLKKLGEEATEIIIAAKNPNPIETVYETADFLYHLMVVMAQKGLTWDDVTDELIRRQKTD